MIHGRPVGVVLTGGASERMGVDKATMVVDGKPMVVRVADALWEASCHPVECQGGDLVAIAEYGMDAWPDTRPGDGPLAAVRDALARHPESDVVVAACDLADLDGDTVRALLAAGGAATDADVAVAATGGERHLLAWWRAGTAERIGALLAEGVTSYRDAVARLRAIDVEVGHAAMRNLNTPTDVDARG
jgi:molybdopterin-guanine dinucleotide biosynthesis protein A